MLDAATQVFLAHGFVGAKMTVIAKKAGASMETLYSRYPTKSALFAAILERLAAEMLKAVGPLSAHREPRDALTLFAQELLAMMASQASRQLHRVVIAGSIDAPELGEMFWNFGPGRGLNLISSYLRDTLKTPHPRRSAEALLAMLVGGHTLRSNLGLRSPLETKRQQRTWAKYVIETFLQTMDTSRIG